MSVRYEPTLRSMLKLYSKEDLWDKIQEKNQRISELEDQLAEKEKEIENLTLAHFESETNKPVLTTTQIINQDKISFAVEQLKEVKEWVIYYSDLKGQNWDYTLNYLNDQIKQLKEMK